MHSMPADDRRPGARLTASLMVASYPSINFVIAFMVTILLYTLWAAARPGASAAR